MSTEDYEIDYDNVCPKCGGEVHYRDCTNMFCDEGEIDEYENDPINFMEGESYITCRDCHGTGVEVWCSKCAADLCLHEFPGEDNE